MTSQTPLHKSPLLQWGKLAEDKDRFNAYVNHDYTVKLIEILDRAEDSLKYKVDYDCPSWACKQADINGRLAMIKLIKELLNK